MIQLSVARLSSLPAAALALFAGQTAHAANFRQVDRAEWTASAPDYLDMFIATPDNMPERPPVIVNIHSCGNSAGGQYGYQGFAPIREALDSVGFIMIIPQQSRNCWNVGAPESLEHDAGGDTGAIVEMVQYAIDNFGADPSRVYAMGGSGGGMAVQALLAVYPDVFKAGHARAGVPAGCWAENYDDSQQWSNECAGGSVDKTPEQWGNLVRSYHPDHNGPRPRVQINHGEVDETISFNNYQEGIDQWADVLRLSAEPTATDEGFMGSQTYPNSYTYDRQFWNDECGYTVLEMWTANDQGHGMGYESQHILEFFGLDQVREQDPWDELCGDFVFAGAGTENTGSAGDDTSGNGDGQMGPIAAPDGNRMADVGSGNAETQGEVASGGGDVMAGGVEGALPGDSLATSTDMGSSAETNTNAIFHDPAPAVNEGGCSYNSARPRSPSQSHWAGMLLLLAGSLLRRRKA